jgi:hypothetical protein
VWEVQIPAAGETDRYQRLPLRRLPPGKCGAFRDLGTIGAKNFVVVSGELKKVRFADRVRSFARCCGTPILFQVSQDSESVDVTIVSLDDPTPYCPEMIIWTEDKLPWVILDPEMPSYPQTKN